LIKALKLTIASIILVWCGGFFYFLQIINHTPINSVAITDAIVVFGGDSNRLRTGTLLLQKGYAPLIFITCESSQEEYTDLIKKHVVIPEQFIVGTDVANCKKSHAADTELFLEQYQLRSLRLVVDSVQLPRALMELSAKLPPDTIIVPHETDIEHKDYVKVLKEYIKYSTLVVMSVLGVQTDLKMSYS